MAHGWCDARWSLVPTQVTHPLPSSRESFDIFHQSQHPARVRKYPDQPISYDSAPLRRRASPFCAPLKDFQSPSIGEHQRLGSHSSVGNNNKRASRNLDELSIRFDSCAGPFYSKSFYPCFFFFFFSGRRTRVIARPWKGTFFRARSLRGVKGQPLFQHIQRHFFILVASPLRATSAGAASPGPLCLARSVFRTRVEQQATVSICERRRITGNERRGHLVALSCTGVSSRRV